MVRPWSYADYPKSRSGRARSSPNGVRTRVSTLRGWCPRPLDDGAEQPTADDTGPDLPDRRQRGPALRDKMSRTLFRMTVQTAAPTLTARRTFVDGVSVPSSFSSSLEGRTIEGDSPSPPVSRRRLTDSTDRDR